MTRCTVRTVPYCTVLYSTPMKNFAFYFYCNSSSLQLASLVYSAWIWALKHLVHDTQPILNCTHSTTAPFQTYKYRMNIKQCLLHPYSHTTRIYGHTFEMQLCFILDYLTRFIPCEQKPKFHSSV